LRKIPFKHLKTELLATPVSEPGVSLSTNDVFIYNPYSTPAKGAALQFPAVTIVVCNEPVYFDIILANPFTFALDIQALSIRTSGVEFESGSVSTVIPPETRVHRVSVSGIGKGCGELVVVGCTARMFSGSVEEDIAPIDGEGMKFSVIAEQPLLRAELGLAAKTGAMMLLQGEMTSIELIIGNVGNVDVDYMTISISESYDIQLRRKDAAVEVETLESAYERDVFDHGTRSFWIQEVGKQADVDARPGGNISSRPSRIEVNMKPGDSHTAVIGVYGKQYCNGCTFQIEYGCLGSSPEESPEFYTRQLYLPLLVAVRTAIKVQNPDILLFGKEIKWREDDDDRLSAATGHPRAERRERRYSLEEMMVDPFGFSGEKQSKNHLLIKNIPIDRAAEYCLLTFDLKNVWNHLFEVVFEIYEGL
jgi:hypothetical protein